MFWISKELPDPVQAGSKPDIGPYENALGQARIDFCSLFCD